MSPGTITEGHRRPNGTRPWRLEPGEYCQYKGQPWARLPSGVGPCLLAEWSPVWHEDGTLTLSPSIQDRGTPDGWHGWLERGVWREA